MVGESAVELHIDPALHVAVVDQQLLEAVVLGAVLNAIRLRVDGNVSVACASKRGQYRIDVAYSAPPIPGREKTLMFAQWPKKMGGAAMPLTIAGLGLVQRLARQIGASVNYSSDPSGKQHVVVSWQADR
jgi:K+-sensing histidine kinase KdpD